MLQEKYAPSGDTNEQNRVQAEIQNEAAKVPSLDDFDSVHRKELLYDPDFYKEEIKKAMERDGSVPEKTQDVSYAHHNVEEARRHQREGIHTLYAQRLAELENIKIALEEGKDTSWAKDGGDISQNTLLLLTNREINNIETALLYEELDGYATTDAIAESLYDKMQEMFQAERDSLEADIQSNSVKVRDIELQKMAFDAQIHWIKKQMWELHTDESPEKAVLQEQIVHIQQEEILPLAKEALIFLKKEERELASKTSIPVWTMEQRYVYGAAAEFVHLVHDIGATLPKEKEVLLNENTETKMVA
jgi:hypothetical protein